MKEDCPACKIRICPEHQPPRPIKLGAHPPPDDSGFLIVRFKLGILAQQHQELATAAKEAGLGALTHLLETFKLMARPLITSVKPDELERIEQTALRSELPPLRSLSTYWRVDVRHLTSKLEEIEAAFWRLPEVELVYREKTPSDPVNAGDDTYPGSENFLDAAPTGVDARWVWTQPNGDGTGMHFIDLEQGLLGHEDLPSPTLIFNDNPDGAVDTGEITALPCSAKSPDNTKGIIGIAPNVASLRTVSWWRSADPPGTLHLADALLAAVAANPPASCRAHRGANWWRPPSS